MLENIACIKQCPAYAVLYFFPKMPVIFIRPIKYLRKHKISHKHKCTLSSTYMIFCCCFFFLTGPNTSICTVGTLIVAYKATAHMQLTLDVFENRRPHLNPLSELRNLSVSGIQNIYSIFQCL